MSTKIGTPEWIEKVTKSALDNRANQLNPNNIRYSARPGKECASQSITALGYGLLAAGIATGIAIGCVAAYAYKHIDKKNRGDQDDVPQELIDIPTVVVDETGSEPLNTEESAGCA